MKALEDYMNYAFETYTSEGRLLNRIDGPGHLGTWLEDLFAAPDRLAVIPAPYEKVAEAAGKERCWRTVMIALDTDGAEINGKTIEATMVAPESEAEARALARKFGCGVFYYSYWEETRMIIIICSDNDEDYPESDDWWYYTVIDF